MVTRFLIASCLFVVSAPSTAANLLSCVDPRVIEAFVARGPQSEFEITDTVPAEFSDIDYIQDFELIGTSRSNRSLSVAFLTNHTSERAVAILQESLTELGWSPVEDPRLQMRQSGFQSAEQKAHTQIIMCDSSEAAISVSARESSSGTIAHIWRSPTSLRSNSCSGRYQVPPSMDDGYTSEIMPILYLPIGATHLGSGRGGMIRSIGDDASSHVRINAKLSTDAVLDHFTSQLADQGWILESSWAGQSSVGTSWNLDKRDLPETDGTLVVHEHSPGDFTVHFLMIAL